MRTICASSVSLPTRCACMTNAAGGVDCAAGYFAALRFFDGNWFAGDHRFIDRGRAVEDDAVDRNFFAGPDAQTVAGLHPIQRHVFFSAVVVHQSRASSAPGRAAL